MFVQFRFLRRWNQSGQKYAGAPDIVSFFRSTPLTGRYLWSLVSYTYSICFSDALGALRQAGHSPAIGSLLLVPIIAGSIAFKIAFTWNDEPELVECLVELVPVSLQSTLYFLKEVDLVLMARAIYGAIGVAIVYIIMEHLSRCKHSNAQVSVES